MTFQCKCGKTYQELFHLLIHLAARHNLRLYEPKANADPRLSIVIPEAK
jgi:hypothetical protein